MIDAGGIEQPDTWEAGPQFGRNPMKACPYCGHAMAGSSTYYCDGCRSEWTRDGRMYTPPFPGAPEGCLLVWEDDRLTPNDVPVWDGMAIRKGNIIEF